MFETDAYHLIISDSQVALKVLESIQCNIRTKSKYLKTLVNGGMNKQMLKENGKERKSLVSIKEASLILNISRLTCARTYISDFLRTQITVRLLEHNQSSLNALVSQLTNQCNLRFYRNRVGLAQANCAQ